MERVRNCTGTRAGSSSGGERHTHQKACWTVGLLRLALSSVAVCALLGCAASRPGATLSFELDGAGRLGAVIERGRHSQDIALDGEVDRSFFSIGPSGAELYVTLTGYHDYADTAFPSQPDDLSKSFEFAISAELAPIEPGVSTGASLADVVAQLLDEGLTLRHSIGSVDESASSLPGYFPAWVIGRGYSQLVDDRFVVTCILHSRYLMMRSGQLRLSFLGSPSSLRSRETEKAPAGRAGQRGTFGNDRVELEIADIDLEATLYRSACDSPGFEEESRKSRG